MSKVNPFKPHSPVPSGLFAGRINEINEYEKGLFQTKHDSPCNFLVTGERGIGKSSLLSLFKPLAKGEIKSLNYDAFNFVTINTIISDSTTLLSFIKMIENSVKREVGKLESIRSFLNDAWSFVERIKIMDSGIDQKSQTEDPDIIIDSFSYSLSQTSTRIANPEKGEESKDGIIFFIDEADNACADLRLGYFFKTVTELLQQHGCNNIMFVVAGLPEVNEKLKASHESSLRVFTELKIKELSPDERFYVIDKAIEKGNEINAQKTTISNDAKGRISVLSEGYPHFIQQFGYSAFDFNTDGEISDDDVLAGAFKPSGAIDAIGSRYYASQYHEQIKSDEYREVLKIMAESMNEWIKKSDIRSEFSGSDQTLTDALKALTTRSIILKNASKLGEYRLQQKGFALWIKLFGERKK